MSQRTLERLLGPARLQRYLDAADGDHQKAGELYLWATQLAGALHAQLSFVEVAMRNTLDPVLANWNSTQPGYGADWTAEHGAAPLLYGLLKRSLALARKHAANESQRRPRSHARRNAAITRDDVISQLTFGDWVKLIHDTDGTARQARLWIDAVHGAFPHVPATESERIRVGSQLETMRRLRNRVAHHDNLLNVNVRARLNESLSLLAKIDPDFPTIAAGRSTLRRLAREDPRLAW